MRYTKMHGIGNDYLFVFGEVPANAAALAVKYSNRQSGIGSDGMIYINYSEIADFSMRIFNADGSEADVRQRHPLRGEIRLRKGIYRQG